MASAGRSATGEHCRARAREQRDRGASSPSRSVRAQRAECARSPRMRGATTASKSLCARPPTPPTSQSSCDAIARCVGSVAAARVVEPAVGVARGHAEREAHERDGLGSAEAGSASNRSPRPHASASGASVDEKRHVGAERRGEREQLAFGERRRRERVQASRARRRRRRSRRPARRPPECASTISIAQSLGQPVASAYAHRRRATRGCARSGPRPSGGNASPAQSSDRPRTFVRTTVTSSPSSSRQNSVSSWW